MRKILTLSFQFVTFTLLAQSYTSLSKKADSLYKVRDFVQSIDMYEKAFVLSMDNSNDLYNGACSAALAGKSRRAIELLNLAIEKGWTSLSHLKKDPDLTPLHPLPEWNRLVDRLQKKVDEIESKYDRPLQKQLLDIYDQDQNIRARWLSYSEKFGNKSPEVDSVKKAVTTIDSLNLIKVTAILDEHGWVGTDLVGGRASVALFLVIQHADLKVQEKYLPLMREAVKNKKAQPYDLALLEDRVAVGQGKKQIYGSQIGTRKGTGEDYIFPIEDPYHVDERRAAVGLGPLSDYVKRWNLTWDPKRHEDESKLKK